MARRNVGPSSARIKDWTCRYQYSGSGLSNRESRYKKSCQFISCRPITNHKDELILATAICQEEIVADADRPLHISAHHVAGNHVHLPGFFQDRSVTTPLWWNTRSSQAPITTPRRRPVKSPAPNRSSNLLSGWQDRARNIANSQPSKRPIPAKVGSLS